MQSGRDNNAPALLNPTPEAIADIRAFLLEMWRERAAELGHPKPDDLSDSCKFSSLFAQSLFGGRICGWDKHFHLRVNDHIIDINEHAADVAAIRLRGADPVRHDPRFMRSGDVRASLDSCRPRVAKWIERFHSRNTPK